MSEPRRPQPGEVWGYRIGKKPGTPLIPAEVLQLGPQTTKHKVRVRYLAGDYPGLDEWVPKGRLNVPWKDAAAWMADEVCLETALTCDDDDYSETLYWAVRHVFGSLPTPHALVTGYNSRERGVLEIADLPAASRLLQMSEVEILAVEHAFMDRFGHYRAPFMTAVELAKRICSLYPERHGPCGA